MEAEEAAKWWGESSASNAFTPACEAVPGTTLGQRVSAHSVLGSGL